MAVQRRISIFERPFSIVDSRWSGAALIAALVLLAALPYLNTLRNGFVWDDTTQVLNNPYIRSFHHLREIFTTGVWSYRGGVEARSAYYRPLMTLLYLLCFRSFGPRAGVFHLANILFNVLVVVALFWLTERMFKDRALAFAAAAIFALHPVHSEPVNWIAAITDLEATLFYLVTFWLFLGNEGRNSKLETRRRPSFRETGASFDFRISSFVPIRLLQHLGMAVGFVLALLSKETAATLPVVATIYEHVYRDDRSQTRWTQKLSRYGVLWVLLIAYLVFRAHFLTLVRAARVIEPEEILLSAVGLTGQYVWKFLWPVRLSAFYVFPDNSVWDLLTRVPAGLAAFASLAALFWVLWRFAHRVSFGVLWFTITLAPVLNPRWMPANVFSERYLYLPSVGLCWVVAWAVVLLFKKTEGKRGLDDRQLPVEDRPGLGGRDSGLAEEERVRDPGLGVGEENRIEDPASGVGQEVRAGGFSANSEPRTPNPGHAKTDHRQSPAARPFMAAWQWTLAASLGVLALLSAARIVTRNRDWHDEQTFYARTVATSPNSLQMLIDLGQVHYNQGDFKSAENEWLQAQKIAPDYPILLDNLGLLYTRQRRYDDAVDVLQRSIRQSPDDAEAHLNLGEAYALMGRAEPAESELRTAVDLAPLNVRARTTLGEFYFSRARYPEAAEQFGRSLASLPTMKAYLGRGLAYMQMHEGALAESDLQHAAALGPGDSRPHFVLGYFYGEMGRTDEAIREYTIGFKMDPDNQDARRAFAKLKR